MSYLFFGAKFGEGETNPRAQEDEVPNYGLLHGSIIVRELAEVFLLYDLLPVRVKSQ